MDLMRIPALLVAGYCVHRTVTPPNPPPIQKDQITPNTVEILFKHTIWVAPRLTKALAWVFIASDILNVFLSGRNFPTSWKASFVAHIGLIQSTPATSAPGPWFGIDSFSIIGTVLCVYGWRLRSAAYAALGRHFTFELAVTQDQKLVTEYPYTIVRHPSYLGGFTTVVGANLVLFAARGGLVREVLLPSYIQTKSNLLLAGACSIVALQGIFIVGLGARVSSEDRMLKAHFGKQWSDWARKVPYKLVPGLY